MTRIIGEGSDNWQYQYDAINRLSGAQHADNYVYSYDPLGNRLEKNGQYDSFNKLLSDDSFSYKYDVAGNLVQKVNNATGEEIRFAYNGRGRLANYEKAASVGSVATLVASYEYDPMGRRTAKTVDDVRTDFHWIGGNLAALYRGTNRLAVYRYDGGFAAVEFTDLNGTYQVQRNYLDSPKTLVNESGNVVWRNIATPYGLDNESQDPDGDGIQVSFNQRFPGQYKDREMFTFYNVYRNYDPSIGRYLQSDGLGLFDGPNTFAYAHSSPTVETDPTGEFGLVGALIGGGIDLGFQLLANGGNFQCVKWGQVAVSAGAGAIGGGLLNGLSKGAFRLKTVGSNTWSATKHWGRTRNIKALQVTGGQQRHHWLLQQNQGWGQGASNAIKNQPWNINPVSASFNNWMSRGNTNLRSLLGAPPWARGVAGGGALAGGGAMAGDGDGCGC